MTNINLLNETPVKIEDLLLDPNNPRFSKHHNEITHVARVTDEDVQATAYAQMNDSANHFQIDELVEAIMADGFIQVDKIFVEKINTKYLIIEGNRRVTAVKKILKNHESKVKGFELLGEAGKALKVQLAKIPCIVIDTTQPGAKDMMRKILGLRHHGSILPWKPLPAAFNLYQQYMDEYCSGDANKARNPENFLYSPIVAKKVSAMFSVRWTDVREKIKLYRVYLQLLEASRNHPQVVSPDSFSMIEETLGRTALKNYFGYDENKSIFSDEGVEKILDMYFGLRGKNPVITEASAGSSNVRDFAFVVAEGTSEDVDRIFKDREKAGAVKAEVETKRSHRSLQNTLELVLNELNKINLGEIGSDGFAPNEMEHIANIDKKMTQLKRAAGIDKSKKS
ncbi:MAG TPA: ParB N-terminal domain-containing protein [Candidatus Paceibacterota bacterium]